jgi:hypothetical protein
MEVEIIEVLYCIHNQRNILATKPHVSFENQPKNSLTLITLIFLLYQNLKENLILISQKLSNTLIQGSHKASLF